MAGGRTLKIATPFVFTVAAGLSLAPRPAAADCQSAGAMARGLVAAMASGAPGAGNQLGNAEAALRHCLQNEQPPTVGYAPAPPPSNFHEEAPLPEAPPPPVEADEPPPSAPAPQVQPPLLPPANPWRPDSGLTSEGATNLPASNPWAPSLESDAESDARDVSADTLVKQDGSSKLATGLKDLGVLSGMVEAVERIWTDAASGNPSGEATALSLSLACGAAAAAVWEFEACPTVVNAAGRASDAVGQIIDQHFAAQTQAIEAQAGAATDTVKAGSQSVDPGSQSYGWYAPAPSGAMAAPATNTPKGEPDFQPKAAP